MLVCVHSFRQTGSESWRSGRYTLIERKKVIVVWQPQVPPGLSQSHFTGPGKTHKSDK